MRIAPSALTQLAREGYRTLQIPDVVIGVDPNPEPEEDFPDEWFTLLNAERLPSQRGFLYFTLAGWEANRERLRTAFEASPRKRGTWADFVRDAVADLANRHKKRMQKIRTLEQEIARLRAVTD